MYNTGVFVAMGIIVLRHWLPHLRLRLQTDPELQTSSGKEREGQYTSTVDEREKKNSRKFEHICTQSKMQNMTVPLQSQWLGAGQLQAIELIGFSKQIIFSFILPCSLCPTSTTHCLLQMTFHWEGEIKRNETEKKNRKEWSKQRGSWTSLSLRLQSPAKIAGQPDYEAPIWSKHHWSGHDPVGNIHKKA